MRLRLTTATSIAFLATASFALPAGASADSCGPSADVPPTASQPTEQRAAVVCLINQIRTSKHLRPLVSEVQLTSITQRYSNRLVVGGFFAHVDAVDHSTIESRGRQYTAGAWIWGLGENLAWATGYKSSPRQTLAMWMASPGHRENLLDPQWRHVGVGIAAGTPVGAVGATYATEFGMKALKPKPRRRQRRHR